MACCWSSFLWRCTVPSSRMETGCQHRDKQEHLHVSKASLFKKCTESQHFLDCSERVTLHFSVRKWRPKVLWINQRGCPDKECSSCLPGRVDSISSLQLTKGCSPSKQEQNKTPHPALKHFHLETEYQCIILVSVSILIKP